MTFSPPSVFWVFIAGLAVVTKIHTILLLPAIFAGSSGGRLRPVAILLGMTIGFTIIVMVSSTFSVAFSSFLTFLRWISIIFIVGMGAVLYDNGINQTYLNTSNYIVNFWRKHILENTKLIIAIEGFLGGTLLGMSIGVIWNPPVSPILGRMLGYINISQNLLYGAILLFIYSLGFSIPLLIIAYLGKSALGRTISIDKRRLFLKKLSGLILILVGLMVLFGIYEYLIRLLIPYVPVPYLDDYLLLRYERIFPLTTPST